jgi:hypothetical protein
MSKTQFSFPSLVHFTIIVKVIDFPAFLICQNNYVCIKNGHFETVFSLHITPIVTIAESIDFTRKYKGFNGFTK